MSIMDIHKKKRKKTVLTDQELAYCEHDCLAEYYRYIEKIIYIKTVFTFTLLWIITKKEEEK